MWPWAFLLASLVVATCAVVQLARRTHDETVATLRSFDELREALTSSLEALHTEASLLGRHLDHGPRPGRR